MEKREDKFSSRKRLVIGVASSPKLGACGVETYFHIAIGNLLRVAPHFSAPSLAACFMQTSVSAATKEEQTEEVEDDGQGGKREEGGGEEEEEEEAEEEVVVWLFGGAHDGPCTREREGSEWPPDF